MKNKIELIGTDVYIPINKYTTIVMERNEVQDLINDILKTFEDEDSNQETILR